MKGTDAMPEDRLEQIINEMKEETLVPGEFAAAKARVWEKLAHAESAVCAEFRADFAAYAQGKLTDARRLLMDDHLSRCAECRRALAEHRGESRVVAMPLQSRKPRPQWTRWAIAAGLALVAVYAGRDRIDSALAPSGPRATLENLDGSVYRLASGPVAKGASLAEGEVIRTGPGAHAVLRLADGSSVEMNERTELALHAAWSGQTVQLERGDVIVQAAKQRRGHLQVRTRDAVASVKGTVFAVSTGTAGSLVSVVEGSVAVDKAGGETLLSRGQQAATTQALSSVPVREAVAWSPEAERYYELLGVLHQVEKELAADGPALRTQSKLLASVPAQVHLYGAVPNLGGTVQRAVTLIEKRAQESTALRDWWTSSAGTELKTLLDKVQGIAPMLGDEIVFALAKNPSGTGEIPMVMAEVRAGREDALKTQFAALFTGDQAPAFRIADGLLIVSEDTAKLQAIASTLGAGASSEFATELASRYQRGVGWLFAFDVSSIAQPGSPEAQGLGLSAMKHVFFEQRSAGGVDENEAAVTFKGARTGIASWLAAPASAGSAEYISSSAVTAMSASTKNPRQAFDELVTIMSSVAPKFTEDLRQFESKTGVNLSNDVAAALGTDFTVVLEKPAVPLPVWFAAFEVYQPSALDSAMRRFVEAFNSQLPEDQKGKFTLTILEEESQGQRWMGLKSAASQLVVWWTYDRGYMLVSTDKAATLQAIATRNGGFALVRSLRFQQQLPGSGGLHYSGFVWINTQGALSDFAGALPDGSLKTILETRDPMLIVLNGETERIRAVSRTRLTSLVLDALLMAGSHPAGTTTAQVSGKRKNAASH